MSRLPLIVLVLIALIFAGCGVTPSARIITQTTTNPQDQRQPSEASIVANWPSSAGLKVGDYEVFLTDSYRQLLPTKPLTAQLNDNGLTVAIKNVESISGVFVRWHQSSRPILSVKCQNNGLLEYVSPEGYALAGVLAGDTVVEFNNQSTSPQRTTSYLARKVSTLNAFYTGRNNEYLLIWLEELLGDANGNKEVEFSDFGVLGSNYTQKVPNVAGQRINRLDPSGNGKVDFPDYGYVGANYGQKLNGYRVYAVDSKTKSPVIYSNLYQPITELFANWKYPYHYYVTMVNLPNNLTPPFYVEAVYNKMSGKISDPIYPINSVWLPTVLGGVPVSVSSQAQRKVILSWSAMQVPDFNNDGTINDLDFTEIDKSVLNPNEPLPQPTEYMKRFSGQTGQDAFLDYYSMFNQIGKEPRAGALPDLYRILTTILQDRTSRAVAIYRFGPETNGTEPLLKRVGQSLTNTFTDFAPKEGEARYLIIPDSLADLFTYVQNQYVSAIPVTIRNY